MSACLYIKFFPDIKYHCYMATLESIHARCVRTEEGCLLWLGAITTSTGYSRIGHESETLLGHRLVFMLACRELDPEEHVDHKCHNENPLCCGGNSCLHRRCLEPAHLEAVTQPENNRRARSRVVTIAGTLRTNDERGTCKKGLHSWTPENVGDNGRGKFCKPCRRATGQRYYQRVTAEKRAKESTRLAATANGGEVS